MNSSSASRVRSSPSYSGSERTSPVALVSLSRATSSVLRPAGSSHISSSRARWTSVPFAAKGDGGSGRWSIAEYRKARAQSLNDETFEGEREVGSGRLIETQGTEGV